MEERCRIWTIESGRHLEARRLGAGEIVYVLDGNGSAEVCSPDRGCTVFEWKTGALFSMAKDATCRLFNGSGRRGATLIALTIDESVLVSALRSSDPSTSSPLSAPPVGMSIADIVNLPLQRSPERGPRSGLLYLDMGIGFPKVELFEFQPGTSTTCIERAADSHTIVLSGKGHALIHTSSNEARRVEWQAGSIISIPEAWRQQNFNTGATPARHLTMNARLQLAGASRA